MRFEVKRSTWMRGNQDGLLLDNQNMQCCVGFRCSVAGISNADLLHASIVTDLAEEYQEKLPEWYRAGADDRHSLLAKIYYTNDTIGFDDAEREEKLKALFAEGGDEIVFVD